MSLSKYLKPIIFSSLIVFGGSAFAVPARPGLVSVQQPDGSAVEIRVNGDENRNWISTPDGFTLVRDNDGYLTFALNENGRLKSSSLRYSGGKSVLEAESRGYKRNLLPEESNLKKSRSSATQIEGTFPSTGNRKLLMLLVNFADTEPLYLAEAFDAYMNLEGFASTGSFRDFYLENSYGQLDIRTTVTRWITVPFAKSYYTTDNAERLIVDALTLIDSEIDLREFDNDGDGILDGLAVIHQGTGQEASGNTSDIWSHSGTIYGETFDGVKLSRYTIQPEILADKNIQNRMGTIGVMCHEFGHNLGAPDFYDTDYLGSGGEYYGTGVWDLMGSGAWNGPGNSGTQPAGINMWQKIQLGWVTPEVLTETKSVRGMKAAYNNPVAYRIDTTEPGEYFILENRQMEGRFDSALPYHGLIIYHANDNLIADNVISNTVNSKYPQAMYTVSAGAGMDPTENPGSYGWVNSDVCPFPGKRNNTIFHDTSLPSTKSISGRYSYKGLTQINENADGTIDFEFLSYEMPESPVDLTATVKGGTVTLDWKKPASETPVKYNVFRNGEKIAEVSRPGYVDNDPGTETNVTYAVDAVYRSGLISPYSQVRIFLPVNFVTDLKTVADGGIVMLNWDLNTRLSRMPRMSDNFVTNDYTARTLEIAHRFRAEDLAVYRGYDIRYINFLAVQPQTALKVTLRVYEEDPLSGKMTVVSERKVSEFANMQWTNSMLTKAVKITGESNIIISVTYESKNGSSIQALCDLSPTTPGYGNLSRVDNGKWGPDSRADGNFFIAATLRAPVYEEGGCPVVDPVADFLNDTSYPVGFVVYQDGVELGRTDGRSFTHLSTPGNHSYTITSLYKGHNESAAVERSVYVDIPTSVDMNNGDELRIRTSSGTLILSNLKGKALIYDLTGKIVAEIGSDCSSGTFSECPSSASTLTLHPGLYILRTTTKTYRIAIP